MDSNARLPAPWATRLSSLALVAAVGCTGIIAADGSGGEVGSRTPELPSPGASPSLTGSESTMAAPGTPSAGLSGSPGTPIPPPRAPAEDVPTVPDPNIKCAAGSDASSASRLWRLSELQLRNTLRSAFKAVVPTASDPFEGYRLPFKGDVNGADRFSNRARSYGLDEASFRDLMNTAGYMGRRMVTDLKAANCVASADFRGCVAALVTKLGALVMRRPLAADEVEQYASIAVGQKAGGEPEAVATALQALLMSPEVSFRIEAGTAGRTGPMDGYSVASALSYGLTDGPPDSLLMAAAARSALGSAADIEPHVRRLLGTGAGVRKVGDVNETVFPMSPMERFVREYFQYDKVDRVDKSDRYGFHKAWALREGTRRFVQEVLITKASGGLLPALLTSTQVFVSGDTTGNFGVTTKPGSASLLDLPDRAGMLTQPTWLAGFSQPEHNDAIRRGRFVRESLLCQELPELPIGDIPPLDLSKFPVLREGLGAHRSNPGCAGCHRLMDPIGFAFEAFDHVGRPRTVEGGKPVDDSWEIVDMQERELAGVHKGVRELGRLLGQSPTVTRCFVAHAFTYWLGRPPRPGDGCVLEATLQAYQTRGGSFPDLLTSLLASPAFLLRQTP